MHLWRRLKLELRNTLKGAKYFFAGGLKIELSYWKSKNPIQRGRGKNPIRLVWVENVGAGLCFKVLCSWFERRALCLSVATYLVGKHFQEGEVLNIFCSCRSFSTFLFLLLKSRTDPKQLKSRVGRVPLNFFVADPLESLQEFLLFQIQWSRHFGPGVNHPQNKFFTLADPLAFLVRIQFWISPKKVQKIYGHFSG